MLGVLRHCKNARMICTAYYIHRESLQWCPLHLWPGCITARIDPVWCVEHCTLSCVSIFAGKHEHWDGGDDDDDDDDSDDNDGMGVLQNDV